MLKVQEVSRPLRKVERASNASESESYTIVGHTPEPEPTDVLPEIAHRALRIEVRFLPSCIDIIQYTSKTKNVQKAPGEGDNNDPLTWDYHAIVGKRDESGERKFQYDRRQFQPTHFKEAGSTSLSVEEVESQAHNKVQQAQSYHLLMNNCQTYVYDMSRYVRHEDQEEIEDLEKAVMEELEYGQNLGQ
ncbi:hypothetical protein BDV59DRAFT_176165 [Aspergillus ambiguus]|uniref:uncharacterized protein n=1 Tax=Aspergillus ambiguus TaxID=176160 RepID=UPI003CCD3BB3